MASQNLPRRLVLHSGLAGFAALMSRSFFACSPGETAQGTGGSTTASTTGTGGKGGSGGIGGSGGAGGAGGSIDAGIAGGDEFPWTPIPRPKLMSKIADIGPLDAADANGVRVAPGFSARIIANSGKVVAGTSYTWHAAPDGGATYPTQDGGWIYVSNSEVPLAGGVGAIVFDATGAIVDAYRILDATSVNCAGGPTPWDTWLSCEEVSRGQVHECDPRGKVQAIVRPLLGTFKHEAAAVDPMKHHVYLTEDEPDGCFYRFVADSTNKHGFANLSSGKLQVAAVSNGKVTWHDVPDPLFEGNTPTRKQVVEAQHFKGGEGIWWHAGVVYFSTKGDNRIHAYDTVQETITVLYDAATAPNPILTGVDNITVSCCGDVLVAEDGGTMEIIAILPDGTLKPLVQIEGQDESEITGPAFDPSGTRLYFSSQRGKGAGGITYEITGPFHVTV